MDRNSVIGFGLLLLLVIGYVSYNSYNQNQYTKQKQADSLAFVKAHPKPLVDSIKLAQQSAVKDTLNDSIRNAMPPAFRGQAQNVAFGNSKLALQISTKGAYPVSAELKDYKTYGGQPLVLFSGKNNELSAVLPVNNGATSTADLYYTPVQRTEANGDQTIDFGADMGSGKQVHFIYTLPKDSYMVHCVIRTTGMPANNMVLHWNTEALKTEKDIASERLNTQIYYRYTNDDHDYFTIRNNDKKTLDQKTHWLGFRLQYFSTALIADNGFDKVDMEVSPKPADSTVAYDKNIMTIATAASGNEQSVNLHWYIGPNHYSTLKSYKINLEDMVPLGYGLMSFVKYINKWLIIPIFNVLSHYISNYGVIIILMTLIIRLILSFFTYKSYLSAAKMRVLKPELDELRARLGDDQQKFGMEQMKLYREAGVNPLGGCLPTLFQLPILFAMYYFFPSSIELRQKHFLWANDLSTYDSIANLPFSIPFYGDHVSLFTLLMTASSLFLALYNRNMTAQDPNNPMMKWMPYVFPFMLIGVFNKMAAALTFYYFFSNTISILQQFIIQRYIIDEKAIHAKMQENRNKPATPSKWAARLEEMQKMQSQRTKQQPRKKQ